MLEVFQNIIDGIVDLYEIPVVVAEFIFCFPWWLSFAIGLSAVFTFVLILVKILTD